MDTNNIIIRPIKTEDNEGLSKLIQAILLSYNLDKPGTAYFDPYLNKLYEHYETNERSDYWVLTKNDKVFGGIGIGPFDEVGQVAEVQKYYISRELQGLGYGTRLYNIAEHYAREKGYSTLYIETSNKLSKANEVYKHFGFKKLQAPLDNSTHGLMDTWFIKDL